MSVFVLHMESPEKPIGALRTYRLEPRGVLNVGIPGTEHEALIEVVATGQGMNVEYARWWIGGFMKSPLGSMQVVQGTVSLGQTTLTVNDRPTLLRIQHLIPPQVGPSILMNVASPSGMAGQPAASIPFDYGAVQPAETTAFRQFATEPPTEINLWRWELLEDKIEAAIAAGGGQGTNYVGWQQPGFDARRRGPYLQFD